MEFDNFLKNQTEEQKQLSSRIFDLVVKRVLKKIYLRFSEEERVEMEKVFSLDGSESEKENFIKKYMFDFDEIFETEAQKIEEYLKLKIESEI
jgi:DNA repair exonuclease SbcCD ATPase subunit